MATLVENAVTKKLIGLRKRSSSSLVGSLQEIIDDAWLVGLNPTNLANVDKYLFLDIFDPNSVDEDGALLGEQIFCSRELGDDIRLAIADNHSEEEIVSALSEKKVSQSSKTGAYWFSEGTRMPKTVFGNVQVAAFTFAELTTY